MNDVYFFLAVLIAIFGQTCDIITTNAALAHPDKLKEANGIAAFFIKKLGFGVTAFLKVAVIGIGFPVLVYELGHPILGAIVALGAAAAGIIVAYLNYKTLKGVGISAF